MSVFEPFPFGSVLDWFKVILTYSYITLLIRDLYFRDLTVKYRIIFHRFGESVKYRTIFHWFELRNQWNIGLYFIDSKYLEILSLHTTKRNLQRPGIEPGTYRLAIQHSTNELSRLLRNFVLQLHYKESMSIFRKLYNDITQKVLVLSKNSFYEMMRFYA